MDVIKEINSFKSLSQFEDFCKDFRYSRMLLHKLPYVIFRHFKNNMYVIL